MEAASRYALRARASRPRAFVVLSARLAPLRRTESMAQNSLDNRLPVAVPMPALLKGQKAIVTGASSGIGKAIAIALGAAGADVVVNYVGSEQPAADVVKTITASGGRAIPVQCDVSKEDQVQAMFARAIKEFGTVD